MLFVIYCLLLGSAFHLIYTQWVVRRTFKTHLKLSRHGQWFLDSFWNWNDRLGQWRNQDAVHNMRGIGLGFILTYLVMASSWLSFQQLENKYTWVMFVYPALYFGKIFLHKATKSIAIWHGRRYHEQRKMHSQS